MKFTLLLLCAFSALLQGESLKIGYEPHISPEIYAKELAPITAHLKRFYNSVDNVSTRSANNFLKMSQQGNINFVYVGSAYASVSRAPLLIACASGFTPCSESRRARKKCLLPFKEDHRRVWTKRKAP